MIKNPELQRNIWLEFSAHRLIIVPAVVLLILLIPFLSEKYNFHDEVFFTALSIYFVLVSIWGGKLAGDAIMHEVDDQTWDNQRMSSLSPWTMTWGKYLGSTLIAWYGGFFCLAAMIYTYYAADFIKTPDILYLLPICILTGIFSQLLNFITNLASIRKRSSLSRSKSSAFVLLGIVASFYIMGFTFNSHYGNIHWYGYSISTLPMILISLSCFVTWSGIAAYRLMRAELQVKNTPIVWAAFVLFFAIYIAGFIDVYGTSHHLQQFITMYTVMIILTYIIAFAETKDPMTLRRLFYLIKEKNWHKAFETVPAWFVSVALCFIMLFILIWQTNDNIRFSNVNIDFRFYITSIFLFSIRDIGLILFFNISKKRSRADLTAFMYLVILYLLLPILFNIAKANVVASMFLPFADSHPYVTIISALSQAILILFLVRNRWKNYFAKQSIN